MERVKSVMQIRESQGGKTPYSWSGPCLMDLIRKEGVRNGIFQGFSSVLLREIPQFAIYYPSYEYFKGVYSAVRQCPRLRCAYLITSAQTLSNPMAAQFFAGGTAGVIQWLPPIYCLDVIKSRMQTAPQGHYSGVWDCVLRLHAEHGARVFVRYCALQASNKSYYSCAEV